MALLELINFLPKSAVFNADQIRGSSWDRTFESIVSLYNTIPLALAITAFILGFIFALCEARLYLCGVVDLPWTVIRQFISPEFS